jgi:flagellar motor switch protein FliN/FliY
MLLREQVEIKVVVAGTRLWLRDVVRLTPSSVIELDSAAARAVEVSVNGRIIAWGQVVTVNGNYAVRFTTVKKGDRRTNRS